MGAEWKDEWSGVVPFTAKSRERKSTVTKAHQWSPGPRGWDGGFGFEEALWDDSDFCVRTVVVGTWLRRFVKLCTLYT